MLEQQENQPTPVASDFRYFAFISYSSKDRTFARWLQRSIESFRLPTRLREGKELPKKLAPVFLDRTEFAASPNLKKSIEDALKLSRNLVVVCSPNSAKSLNVNEEVKMFIRLGRGDRIFPIIIDGNTPECFPPALLSDEDAPLAADARKFGDGSNNAKLKVIAGMLGIGFDELKQREMARQRSRMAAIAISSLALATVMTGLALFATTARQQAVEQRELAQDNEAVAKQRATELARQVSRDWVEKGDLLAEGGNPNQALLHYAEALRAGLQDGGPFAEEEAVHRFRLGQFLGIAPRFEAYDRITNLGAPDAWVVNPEGKAFCGQIGQILVRDSETWQHIRTIPLPNAKFRAGNLKTFSPNCLIAHSVYGALLVIEMGDSKEQDRISDLRHDSVVIDFAVKQPEGLYCFSVNLTNRGPN